MIVVTGGTGALGTELIKLFKQDSKTVVSVARHENPDADHNLLHDLSDASQVAAVVREIEELDSPLETIINAAGTYGPVPLGEISEEEINRNMTIHIETPMLLISALLEQIKKDGTDIVNVSSIAAVNHSAGAPAYSASKAALRGFSADLQAALKDYPSRVVSICPSSFDDSSPTSPADVAKLIKQLVELPKSMEAAEIIINTKGIA